MTGKTITRVDLYDAIYRQAGTSRSQSMAVVELVFKEIADTLAKGENVKLSGFGSFIVRKKGQRLGRNPKTGVDAPILPRRVLVFKASPVLKQGAQGQLSSTSRSTRDSRISTPRSECAEPGGAPMSGPAAAFSDQALWRSGAP